MQRTASSKVQNSREILLTGRKEINFRHLSRYANSGRNHAGCEDVEYRSICCTGHVFKIKNLPFFLYSFLSFSTPPNSFFSFHDFQKSDQNSEDRLTFDIGDKMVSKKEKKKNGGGEKKKETEEMEERSSI